MFGMGGSEIIVILIVALLFLGPDKLPGAAKTISKGIRDLKKQSRSLQNQIESDEQIGGAIRDLKSALRGEELPVRRPPVPKKAIEPPASAAEGTGDTDANTIHDPNKPADADHDPTRGDVVATDVATDAAERAQPLLAAKADKPFGWMEPATEAPKVTLPATAGEADGDAPSSADDAELAAMIKPAPGTVAKGS
jgi:sec-independent protein translocase protein TatB